MNNAIEFVFDNKDLRKLILTHYVRLKYKDEVYNGIQHLFQELLVKKMVSLLQL